MGAILNKKKSSVIKPTPSKFNDSSITLSEVSVASIKNGFKTLTKEEVESSRSKAYQYIF